jgi:hypothetical protein
LQVPPVPVATSYLERVGFVFKTGLPMVLGVKVPYGGHWLVPGAVILYAAALAGFVSLARRWRDENVVLLAMVAAAYPFLMAIPPTSFYVIEPRYLLYLSPVVALLLARVISVDNMTRQVGALVVVVAMSVGGLVSLEHWSRTHRGHYDLAAGDLGPLLGVLRREAVHTTFADYWVSYRIDFETRESVTAASLGAVRYLPYQERVRASERPAYVVSRGSSPDLRLGAALDRAGARSRRVEAGEYAVYLPDRTVLPEDIPDVW